MNSLLESIKRIKKKTPVKKNSFISNTIIKVPVKKIRNNIYSTDHLMTYIDCIELIGLCDENLSVIESVRIYADDYISLPRYLTIAKNQLTYLPVLSQPLPLLSSGSQKNIELHFKVLKDINLREIGIYINDKKRKYNSISKIDMIDEVSIMNSHLNGEIMVSYSIDDWANSKIIQLNEYDIYLIQLENLKNIKKLMDDYNQFLYKSFRP